MGLQREAAGRGTLAIYIQASQWVRQGQPLPYFDGR